MRAFLRTSVVLVVFGLNSLLVGCSSSQTSPAFTPAEEKAARKEQTSAAVQAIIDLEKQYGLEHSQVQQMKLELGLDPNRPAAEQMP